MDIMINQKGEAKYFGKFLKAFSNSTPVYLHLNSVPSTECKAAFSELLKSTSTRINVYLASGLITGQPGGQS